MEEIRKFHKNFSKLQSDMAVTKQVNTELNGLWPWNVSAGKMSSTLEKNVWN